MQNQEPPQGEDEILRICAIGILGFIGGYFLVTSNMGVTNYIVGMIGLGVIYPFGAAAEALPALQKLWFVGPRLLEPSVHALRFLRESDPTYMTAEQLDAVIEISGRCAGTLFMTVSALCLPWVWNRGSDVKCAVIPRRGEWPFEALIRTHAKHWPAALCALRSAPGSEKGARPHEKRQGEGGAGVWDSGGCGAGLDSEPPGSPPLNPPNGEDGDSRLESVPCFGDGESALADGFKANQSLFERREKARNRFSQYGRESPKDESQKEAQDPQQGESDTKTSNPEADKDEEARHEAEAIELFSSQLRNLWRGIGHLTPARRAVAAVLALHGAGKHDEAKRLAMDLARIHARKWGAGAGMDPGIQGRMFLRRRIDSILASPDGLDMEKAGSGHAWEETALVGMLAAVRDRGRAAPLPQILWLRAEDPGLWSALNGLGRPAVEIGALATLVHFNAERRIGKPLGVRHARLAARRFAKIRSSWR